MEKFEFNSAICTSVEQSKRLLELGLKKETADMHITNMSSKGINYTDDWQIGTISYCDTMSFWDSKGLKLEKTAWSIIPAWSLHGLLLLLNCAYVELDANNPFEDCITRIEYLIKESKIFNKDYLEERK